jgi:hypothetical protein
MNKLMPYVLIFGFLLMTGTALASEFEPLAVQKSVPPLVSSIRIQPPLDFCGEDVPLDNQEVRERLEKELLLTLADRPQVLLWLKRSPRYLPFIEKELAANGMPDDLKYVAFAESALRPHAGSPAGAIGFWQFIRPTGIRYGLVINSDFDERRSIYKSTRAAIDYFKDLYSEFNSWSLAAAAYNMGEEGLRSEILLQEVNDYYRLYLPLETQRYLFRIISAKLVLKDPAKFGFYIADNDLYLPFEFDEISVNLNRRTPIRIIARAAKTDFKRIKDLNPDIRGHYMIPGKHTILVPRGSSKGFSGRLSEALSHWRERPNDHVYIVKSGDNLSSIADKFEIPLPALLTWNNLNPRHHIHPGDRLIIYKQIDVSKEIDDQ